MNAQICGLRIFRSITDNENMTDNIQIIRSRRKTLALEIRGGQLIVRIPIWCTGTQLQNFLDSHSRWIENHLEKARKIETQAESAGLLGSEEIRTLTKKAKQVIPERVKYYASLAGVTYGMITIRNQKTRWGSCSSKGNLNFNCLLMLAPMEVLDSVVVHELCHRKHMNHSRQFYDEVLKVFPDYKKWHKWLKDNGPGLLARVSENKTGIN